MTKTKRIEVTNDSPLEDQLGCFGYFGFGSGFAVSRWGVAQDRDELYCARCPRSRECWLRHMDRVRELFPEVCAIADEVYAEKQRMEGLREFAKRTGQDVGKLIEPYIAAQAANIRDGANCACELPFDDHGDGTLIWPLPSLERQ